MNLSNPVPALPSGKGGTVPRIARGPASFSARNRREWAKTAGHRTLTVRNGQSRPALFCVAMVGRITHALARQGRLFAAMRKNATNNKEERCRGAGEGKEGG